MSVFRPCIGCIRRNDCSIKKTATMAVRHTGITSARLRCNLPYTEDFPPGKRVSVLVWDQTDWSPYIETTPAKRVDGTIVGRSTKKRDKVLIYLDAAIVLDMTEPPRTTRFTTAWPKEVSSLDEPLVETLCEDCGRLDITGDCCLWKHNQ